MTFCENCGWSVITFDHLVECGSDAPWLPLDSAAYSGLAGDVVRAFEPNTEADPAALLAVTLTDFGAMVGGMAEVQVGASHHPPAFFDAIVGRSGRSRKGTALDEVGALMRRVEVGWFARHEVGGFGSGEALIEHAGANPGEPVLLVETEFARVLVVASREGSTVSAVLRQAWDFHRMQLRVRKNTHEAPAAPVSMLANITAEELRDGRHGLRMLDVMNGFGNRVQWWYADRRRELPDPRWLASEVAATLERRLHEALMYARTRGVVARSAEANVLWRDLYARMADDESAGGVIDALTARSEAQVLRLSLVYALLDMSPVIERRHLESAWEVWRYCRWSAQHLWIGDEGTGDPDIDRILDVLAGGRDLSRTDLDRMFGSHRDIRPIVRRALALGVAREYQRPSGERGGRPAVMLTTVDEKPEKPEKRPWWTRVAFRIEGSSGSSGFSPAKYNERGAPDA